MDGQTGYMIMHYTEFGNWILWGQEGKYWKSQTENFYGMKSHKILLQVREECPVHPTGRREGARQTVGHGRGRDSG